MKRPIIRALAVGLLFVILYYGFRILLGMYLTMNYVPDISESYGSVDVLQHTIAFGVALHPARILLEVPGLVLLGAVVYFAVRKVRSGNQT